MNMQNDIAKLKNYCESLRADLAATNSALFAVFASIPDVYREKVLDQFAKRSVQRANYVDATKDPAAEQALARMEAADERVHKELLRVAKERRAEEG